MQFKKNVGVAGAKFSSQLLIIYVEQCIQKKHVLNKARAEEIAKIKFTPIKCMAAHSKLPSLCDS